MQQRYFSDSMLLGEPIYWINMVRDLIIVPVMLIMFKIGHQHKLFPTIVTNVKLIDGYFIQHRCSEHLAPGCASKLFEWMKLKILKSQITTQN